MEDQNAEARRGDWTREEFSAMASGGVSIYQKARQINLDSAIHGTLAQIGAGQEVAPRSFSVGGAASTVAKTISAYDMAISDALYGRSNRYVSRERLHAMLDHEYDCRPSASARHAGRPPAFSRLRTR